MVNYIQKILAVQQEESFLTCDMDKRCNGTVIVLVLHPLGHIQKCCFSATEPR